MESYKTQSTAAMCLFTVIITNTVSIDHVLDIHHHV
jgi:hypothetical protein